MHVSTEHYFKMKSISSGAQFEEELLSISICLSGEATSGNLLRLPEKNSADAPSEPSSLFVQFQRITALPLNRNVSHQEINEH